MSLRFSIYIPYFVYILRCIDSQKKRTRLYYYVGITNDLQKRILQHKYIRDKKTKRYKGNIQLVYIEEMNSRNKNIDKTNAWKREKEIRQWGDKQIETLIRRMQQRTNFLRLQYMR